MHGEMGGCCGEEDADEFGLWERYYIGSWGAVVVG